jgi:hypothetical protein
MKLGKVVAAWAFFFAMIFVSDVRAADDAARPPEFKVLDRWVGDWDLEITVKPNPQNREGSRSTYTSQIRWAVNDRFLHCEAKGQGIAGDRKTVDAFMWIMTHDPQTKAYSSAVFWANAEPGTAGGAGYWGTIAGGVGTWDEKEQMMSIRSEDMASGMVTLSVTQWIDKDNHRWVQSLTEKNGNVVVEMSGTGRRRK